MRFSVWPNPQQPWESILEAAEHAESTGWDGVWFADHFMPNTDDGAPADGPTLECWAVLSALAARVPRVRLGTLVCGNTYRHPAVLANVAAAVDVIGGGERRTMRIAARYADEWNVWGTPEVLRHKIGVLERHCEDLGRDPSTIRRSAQALLFLSEDEGWLGRFRDTDLGRAAIVGTPDEVGEVVQAYVDAGVDERILPDFTLGSPSRRAD